MKLRSWTCWGKSVTHSCNLLNETICCIDLMDISSLGEGMSYIFNVDLARLFLDLYAQSFWKLTRSFSYHQGNCCYVLYSAWLYSSSHSFIFPNSYLIFLDASNQHVSNFFIFTKFNFFCWFLISLKNTSIWSWDHLKVPPTSNLTNFVDTLFFHTFLLFYTFIQKSFKCLWYAGDGDKHWGYKDQQYEQEVYRRENTKTNKHMKRCSK